jgi:hypothetical protein
MSTTNWRSSLILVVASVIYVISILALVGFILDGIGALDEETLSWLSRMETERLGYTIFGLSFILAFIPISLAISLFLGNRRERIKGDLWADLERLQLQNEIRKSSDFDRKMRSDETRPPGMTEENYTYIAFSKRFDDLYGGMAFLLPALLYLMICFGGWLIVFFPNGLIGAKTVDGYSGFLTIIQRKGLQFYLEGITTGGSLIAYAFLGAYIWSLQDMVRRFWASDLKPSSYVQATLRVVSGIVLSLILRAALPDDLVNVSQRVIAFFLGIATLAFFEWFWKLIVNQVNVQGDHSFSQYPLTHVKGINPFIAERLREENIEDFHSLSSANLVNLLTRVRYPTQTVVDWVDKALLLRTIEDEQLLETLQGQLSVITASDLLDIWNDNGQELTKAEFIRTITRLYHDTPDMPEDDVRMENMQSRFASIITSIRRNPNINAVYNYWLDYRTIAVNVP